jgi:hypothetical protein
MEGKKVASIKNQPLFCQRIGLRKSAMFLKGNGCGTMDPTLFIQKKAALTWLNRPPAKEMVGLILSTKIGGGSLMHANCRGKIFFFFLWHLMCSCPPLKRALLLAIILWQ